ncbi:MAG: hypothetical protein IJL74_01530 [Bacilli bacterium]|nr:hypothetical protein [Bacilli bacterium]
MKYCENCGTKLDKNDSHCPKCDKKEDTPVVKEDKKEHKNEGLGTASMVIGIVSLVLSLLISVLVFPLALVGLILGIVNKAQNGKKVSGIILNGIAMLLSAIVFIALITFLTVYVTKDLNDNHEKYSEYIPSVIEEESLIGRWNCKKTDKIADKDYELSVVINDNDTFSMYDSKESKNYIEGEYQYRKEAFGSIIKTKRMYILHLNGEKEYVSGKYVVDNNRKYEMIVTNIKGKLHAVLYNDNSDINYYCNK